MKKMISFLVFDIIVIEKGKYMEKNEEMEELKQKVLVCVIVFLFVIIIGFLFIFNRFGSDVDAVSKALRDKEDFVVFFRSDFPLQSCYPYFVKFIQIIGIDA